MPTDIHNDVREVFPVARRADGDETSSTDADWVSDDEAAEVVEMWTYAVRLIDYTVDTSEELESHWPDPPIIDLSQYRYLLDE